MTATAILPRAAFRSALQAVVKTAVEKRNTLPVLCNVAIHHDAAGRPVVRGTDLDIEVSAVIEGAAMDEGFGTTLPGHKLVDIEKRTDETEAIAIDTRDGSASLDFEGLRVNLASLPDADLPHVPFAEPIHADLTISAGELLEAIKATAFAISTEETRYYLNGIFLHGVDGHLRAVATDGHRLARFDFAAPCCADFPRIIIPRRTVDALAFLLARKGAPETVRLVVNTVKIKMEIGGVTVVSKLIDGTFPDYSRVIPTAGPPATFGRADFAKALRSVTTMASERGRAFKLDLQEGAATLIVSNPDLGTASRTVPAEISEPCTIGFNSSYMADILGVLDGDEVTMRYQDNGSPAVFTGADERLLILLMPMRA